LATGRPYNRLLGSNPTFQQRTDWAEYFIAQLARQPLISECVYHCPQRIDRTPKEVVDILFALAGRTILLSLKCQKEPGSFSAEKEATWVMKAATDAANQVGGAVRTIHDSSFWCEHPRRGRVQFARGELRATHGVVLVEAVKPARLSADIPLHLKGMPISYFAVNDFCNILQELRTIPEIEAYLDARRALPLDALRVIGQELSLYEYYLLNSESFSGCCGHDDARLVSAGRSDELHRALARKAEADRYAGLIERVADCLAERNAHYLDGIPEESQVHFDPSTEREGYLRMQVELCDLRLGARALLGRHFAGLIDKADKGERPAMAYAAVHLDSKPDLVYVFASGRGVSRAELLERGGILLEGAMAFYEKRRGMVVVDRDSAGFEVSLLEVPSHSIAAFHAGERLYGRLRMDHIPAMLVPEAHS
jgi:hypothetical protein